MEITIDQIYEFKACPLRYKLTEVDKVKKVFLNESNSLRKVILATLSYFYVNLHQGDLLSLEALKEKFTSLWYDKSKLLKIKFDDNENARKKELAAFSMLASFHRRQRFHPDKTVGVNVDFRIPIANDFFITGRIPVIRENSRGTEIVNFKTSTKRPTQFFMKTDMSITAQAIAYHSLFKREPDSIIMHHLKTAADLPVERVKQDYKRLYKSAQMMKKAMDEGWYYPLEGFHCDNCPVQNLCMEWR